MIYDVRLREILIHEIQVEDEDLKSAFLTAIKKAHSKKFKSRPIARYFELEQIYKGKSNELTSNQSSVVKKSNKRRTGLPKKGKDRQT